MEQIKNVKTDVSVLGFAESRGKPVGLIINQEVRLE
jgi:hypothetical protein